MTLLKPGAGPEQTYLPISSETQVSGPLVSCLMITRGGIAPARFAIQCYQRQTYTNRELVIVCDTPGSAIATYLAGLGDPSIRYIETAPATLGELRNTSVAHSRGDLLCQWDDDDLYHPARLALQAAALECGKAEASFLARWLIWWPARSRMAVSSSRIWEGSMLVRRAALPIYPAQARGEDGYVARLMRTRDTLALLDQPFIYCYIVHGRNTCGEAHFEMLFANASFVAGASAYAGDLATLEAVMPFSDYARILCMEAGG